MLTRHNVAPLILSILIVGLAIALGAPVLDQQGSFMVAMAVAAAAPAAQRPDGVTWGRKRDPAKTFNNVGANQTAYSYLPNYPRTLLQLHLDRSGSGAFTDANLSRLEIFAGEQSIWGPINGTDLRMVENYIHGEKESGFRSTIDDHFITLDFTLANVKEIGGEQIGGLDLRQFQGAQLRVEAEIGGATTPQFRGHSVWGPPQGTNDMSRLMRKLIKRTYPAQPAGDFYPEVNVRGAILCRQFWKGIVYNTGVFTAFTAANHGTANTGTGAMGTITVGSLTPAGRYTLKIIEPGANVGTFSVQDPTGKVIGTGTVASAVTIPAGQGSLAFTLADATDFISGDGGYIDVLPLNTDGNITFVELKKNEDVWWRRTSRAARFEQFKNGRSSLAGLEVSDYILDNHADGVIDTAYAAQMDYLLNFTATDTPFVIHEVLALPSYNAKVSG